MAIELGQKVKDPITGYKGIAIGKTIWLYGCTRIGVQAIVNKEGKVPELQWFDEPQLEAIPPKESRNKGGPQPNPTRRFEEKR
jgi:hypothetical protein